MPTLYVSSDIALHGGWLGHYFGWVGGVGHYFGWVGGGALFDNAHKICIKTNVKYVQSQIKAQERQA